MRKIKVSIIIVYYKNKKKLFDCLDSIKENKLQVGFEVIVVDNSERKTIKEELQKHFNWVKYIKSPGNTGYGAGNNLGVKNAKGEFILVLNPDTKIMPGAITNLVNFLEKNKKVGIVAPNLLDKKGGVFPQLGSSELTPIRGIMALSFLNKIFPNNPISRKYWLKGVSLNKRRKLDVVPGSAFMIRKKVFEKVGRFDENMFLFFEESDLCRRVKKLGLDIFIIPEAEVFHYWDKDKHSSEKMKKIFAASRFYYFKRHFGLLWALLVEIFARFSKWNFMFLLVFVLGIFLRFYRLPENIVFTGEIGHNYLAIKNFVQNKQIPLVGPPTSHPWLYFGPLFYWILAPFLILFKYNPIVGSYFFAVLGSLLLLINFMVVRKVFNNLIAVLSSLFLAVSPSFVELTRQSRFFSLVVLLFYPFYLSLLKLRLFWMGLIFGLMMNFHLSVLILLPAVLIFLYMKKSKLRSRDFYNGLLGFLVPNIPFLIYDAKDGFLMTRKLIMWIPYRIAGFLGFYPKNNLSSYVFDKNLEGVINFISRSFITDSFWISSLVVFVFLISLYLVWKKNKGKRKDWNIYLLPLFFILGYLAIFIHGVPPQHYFLPLYPIPIILISYFLSEIFKWNWGKYFSTLFVLIVLLVNFKYFFSGNYFYKDQDRILNKLVPYKLQLNAVNAIIRDAGGRDFVLERVGPFDYFEGDYAQNYQYLLWWKRNEPKIRANTEYTIYEGKEKSIDISSKMIFNTEDLKIVRKEK